jgi:glycerol-3-phosphate dehydrogenase
LPYRAKGPESAITRRHIIKVNRKIAKGLISIIGGKLTTYRNLGEQTVNRLAKVLRRKLPECRTRDVLLPGAWGIDRSQEQLLSSDLLTPLGCERLLSIYGGRASEIVDLATAEADLQASLDEDGHYLAAEVVFAIREEFAMTLTDIVFRRMMTGFLADQGRPLYDAVASRAAAEFGWSSKESGAQRLRLYNYADSLLVSSPHNN